MDIRSAIKRHKSVDTATVPATPVRCKHCNRSFAAISADGGLNPLVPHQGTCMSCESFLGLYNTLRAREQQHTALLDRGPKHHGRILAHEQFRKARVALENFLVSIEAPNNASFDIAQPGFANYTELEPLRCSQRPQDVPELSDHQGSRGVALPPGDHATASAPSPTTKRKLGQISRISIAERKRIRFGEEVEERPEYRGTLEYYRGAKEYVPGRYAVIEGSEYEDTSGSTLSFVKFTGQKKVGSKFVDVTPKEEAQDGKEALSATQKTSRDGKKNLERLGELESHEKEKDESKMNSRELRLSRRGRSRGVPAQYDTKHTISEEAVGGAPALVVSSEVPQPPKDHDVVDEDKAPPVPRRTQEGQWSSGDAGLKATSRASESAVIRGALSNIERELGCLQQTVVSPQYADMISKVVRVCQEALEPLKRSEHVMVAEAESPPNEDDSIYFEASDGTGGSSLTDVPNLRQNDPSRVSEVVSKRSGAPVQNRDSDEPSVSPLIDANMLDDMPKGDIQNLSETLDLRQEGKEYSNSIDTASNGRIIKEEAKWTIL